MTCDDFRELISADLDGELRAGEDAPLFAHLSGCAMCREWRREQLIFRAELHQWPQENLPEEIAAPPAIQTATRRTVYRIPRAWAWAAAILLLVQSAVTVSSYMARSHTLPIAFDSENESAETIVLTTEDRIRYAVQSFPIAIPTETPGENGG